MASTCMTWRWKLTADSSERDPLEEALGDLVRAAQQDLDGASRMEVPGSKDGGELVERPGSVSFILLASGYCLKDFRVKVVGGELRVDSPDFEITRALGCGVDPHGVKTEYRNGVLSVRVAKKF